MKKLGLLFCFITFITFVGKSQSAYQEIRDGNELFKLNNYTEAENKYRESIQKDTEPVESSYNLGNSLYRQGKFEDAGRYFNQAANKTEDKLLKSKAYHNLGNSLIKEEKLEEGIKAYKNALINDPKNEESRYNLAYAQKMLQKQQEQQQQEQEDKKDDKKEENQDQQENKDQENQEDKKEEEEKDQQGEEEKKDEEQQQDQQQPQQQEQQVSREDAERILEALNNKEKELQEKLKKKKVKAVDVEIEKDW